MESHLGTAFGKYTIVGLVGRGGMGDVYEAYDTEKRRTVALKVLAERFSNDPTFRARFQRESHAAASLQEPHVIPIHDWGEINGRLYIDMRLVRGKTLDELIARGSLPPARAVAIIAQIGAALDAAHAEGLLHRDIKPHNIIVTDADFAYLVDFGIAETRGDTRLTTAGTPVGTVHYMAPERFTGGDATPAVDVYSLACVLYEMLTGEAPFARDSLENVVGAHLASPVPRPSAGGAQVPAAFDAVIARGMAKDPDERYGTAGGLVRAARRATDGNHSTRVAPERQSAAPGRDTGPHRRVWLLPAAIAAGTVALLGAAGLVIGLLTQPELQPAEPVQSQPETAAAVPFRGVVLQQPSVEVRNEPVLAAAVTGYLPFDSEVYIVCTTIGDVVQGPGAGGGPSISTPVWDKVRTTVDGPDIGFVPDAWVNTGTAAPKAAAC